MTAIPVLKPLALLSFSILAGGLLFLVLKWPQGRHATFSQHAAAQKPTILYYIGLFAISLPLLLIFFLGWFVPRFHLPITFVVCAVSSMALQHTVTLIPEVGGWKTRWHRILTGFSAVLLIPMIAIVATSKSITEMACSIAIVGFLIMLGIALQHLFLSNKERPRNQLLLQAGYYGAFFVAILFATYQSA